MDKVLDFSHYLLKKVLSNQDIAIDMTAGRGNDTLFLADICKKVYTFDIQQDAILETRNRANKYNNIVYINDGHEHVKKHVYDKVKGIIFNLGYLPNGDKNITTKKETTLLAIKDGLDLLMCGGIMVICLYPGHSEGYLESEAVVRMLGLLNQKEYDVLRYEFINQINNPPFLIAVKKKI